MVNYIINKKAELEISSALDYFLLLKPRVMSLAVFTAFVGQMLALQNTNTHPLLVFFSLFSIALGAGAAGCINMWYDKDIDAVMKRTKNRPIPRGVIKPAEALALGIILSIISVLLLTLSSNLMAGILLAITIMFYVFVYTIWLKRKTYQNIVIGGAAGALPPVIGWLSISNDFNFFPIILFLIIFIWTPSHFWALSLYKSEEYKKANIPMLPIIAGIKTTKYNIFIYALILLAISLLPFFLGFSGLIYFSFSILLGFYYIYLCYKLLIEENSEIEKKISKKIFLYSIFYLFLIFTIILLDNSIII